MAIKRIQPVSGIIVLVVLALGCGYGIYAMASVTEHTPIGLRVVTRNIPIDSSENPGTYRNAAYNIELTPPEGWKTTETTPIGLAGAHLTVAFTDPATADRLMFSVFDSSLRGTLRNTLSVISEEKTTIGTLPADKWVGEDTKDGSPVTIVIAEKNGLLYEVTSYAPADMLDSFLSTFKMVQ